MRWAIHGSPNTYVDVLEPSVIFEAKYGKYGEDGSETLISSETKE